MEYILSAIFLFLLVVLLISFSVARCSGEGVKIIINADTSKENTEWLLTAAREVAERYLQGAEIYIEGENEMYIDLLCTRYNAKKL